MTALNEAEKSKLAKVLQLMDSPVEGERIAASEAASRLINAHDLSWGEVFGLKAATKSNTREKVDPPEDWKQKVDLCFLNLKELSKRDIKLIKNLRRYRGRPYPSQIESVERILQEINHE